MTTAASPTPEPGERSLAEGASPATIRAALRFEDRGAFDHVYGRALELARERYDLRPVHDVVEEWRRRAISQSDPVAFERMVRRAAEFFSGAPVPDDEPFEVTLAKAGM